MKPKRKRGKALGKEGWATREEVLGDFFSSPGIPQSQSHTIEWSSSEDEENAETDSKSFRSKVQKNTSVAKKSLCAFPQEDVDCSVKKKLRVVKDCNSKLIGNQSKDPSEGDKKQSKTQAVITATSCNSVEDQQRQIPSFIDLSEVSEPYMTKILKTPSKNKTLEQRCRNSEISPIIGSQRKQVLPKTLCKQRSTDEGCISEENLSDPLSPVLGLSDNAKEFKRSRSPILGSLKKRVRALENTSKHGESRDSALCQTDSLSPPLGTRKTTYLNQRIKSKKNKESAIDREASHRRQIKSRSLCQAFSKDYQTEQNTEIGSTTSQAAEIKQDLTSEAKKMPAYLSLSFKLSQEENDYGTIDSHSSTPEIGSQLDVDITHIDSSFRDTQPVEGKSSEESGEPSISVDSVVSPEETVENAETVKRGSDWIRALQKTPEKPSYRQETEVNVESTKKRTKKDGHAGRLRRLIRSWQSSVQMLSHQLSAEHFEVQVLKPEEKPVTIFSPGSAKTLIKKELHYDTSNKGKNLQGIRNLQSAFIDSPQNSPGILAKDKMDLLQPKKILQVRILHFVETLPSNAAVCDILYDGSSSQETIKADSHLESHKLMDKIKYLVFFNFLDQKTHNPLHVDDQVKIFSPWQVLDTPSHEMPILFTAYFTVYRKNNISEQTESEMKDSDFIKEETCERKISSKNTEYKNKKTVVLATWSCSCVADSSVLPSMCEARQHKAEFSGYCKDVTSQIKPGFRVVKDVSQEKHEQSDDQPAWTVLEAIEKCGGISETQVTISVRAHRIICHSESKGKIEMWEVIGQDASGIFCSIRIPNRPLVRQLTQMIEEGEGTTCTLTHVNVIQRITNTQNPALFSMISSLHCSYQKTLKEDPLLYPILADHVTSSSQSYCYVFTVNLGATELLKCNREVVIPITLPTSSLQYLSEVTVDGQRGSLNIYILYKVGSMLYVMSQHESDETEKSKKFSKENTVIARIVLSSKASLPMWIPDSGTVMIYTAVRDVVVWNGSAMIDEYSLLKPQTSEVVISLSTLVKILDPLSSSSICHDLVVVSGTINKVDEDTAYTWLSCSKCGGADVQELEVGGSCSTCGQSNAEFVTEFFMEVWINCGEALQNANVKVKLCQTAIKKLLSSCEGAEEGYDASSLTGKQIGPMVCILEEVKRPKQSQPHSYRLLQLPY